LPSEASEYLGVAFAKLDASKFNHFHYFIYIRTSMFKMFLGPMCSGKSLEMIEEFSRLKIADKRIGLFQPERNVRDEHIESRNGGKLEAIKISKIADLLHFDEVDHIGIDEIHMFNHDQISKVKNDAKIIKCLLQRGKQISVSRLDLDYQGRMFNIIKVFLELGPDVVVYKRSVCSQCKMLNAAYSQIMNKSQTPITRGLPPVNPDDGNLLYEPRCRNCFVKK